MSVPAPETLYRHQLGQALAVWRHRAEHPICRRERGDWGRPHPFHRQILRYAPLVLVGVVILGGVGFGVNQAALAASGLDSLAGAFCLLCLPGLIVRLMTVYGAIMAPALTAPSIGGEEAAGTWEMLRATPYSVTEIVAAKFFGAMSEVTNWSIFLFLSAIFGVVTGILGLLVSASPLEAVAVGLGTAFGPPLSILFAGLLGLAISLRVRDATPALALSYGGLILFRLVNGELVWMAIGQAMEGWLVVMSTGPPFTTLIACCVLTVVVLAQVRRRSLAEM